MKKVMILGSSLLQLPAIIKAKEMGYQVISVDMDPNAIGFKYAKSKEVISTTDIESVLKAAKKHNIDGIMTLASDMPMRTVAAVSSELNLVGISTDTAIKATNKVEMRKCLKANKVPIPVFYCAESKEEYFKAVNKINGKCIIKPADNSGSRGVFLLEDSRNTSLIEHAFEYSKKHSRNGEIIIEEYMEGSEVSVETISTDGKCHIIQITDKLTTGSPHFIELGHSEPTVHSKKIEFQIVKAATEAVEAIGIKTGPAHVEVMVTQNGPKIVEIGARLGGDNITTHLVPLSTGIDMVGSCIQIALGETPNLSKKYNMGSAIRYFNTQTGRIKSINGVEEARKLKGIKQISFNKYVGDEVSTMNSSNDRIGFVIAQGENGRKSIYYCEDAIAKINIEIAGE